MNILHNIQMWPVYAYFPKKEKQERKGLRGISLFHLFIYLFICLVFNISNVKRLLFLGGLRYGV